MPADFGNKSGERSLTHAGADEWLGLRPFRDGDSPRQVDWKAYARDAPLLVKEYSAAGAEMRIFDLSHAWAVWGWRRNWNSWRDGWWMRRPTGSGMD